MSRFNVAALLLLCIGVSAAGPSLARKRHHRPKHDRPPERCTVTDCFNERDIRNFDILDNTTMVVYTGARQCPFRVDLAGYQCRLNLAPSVNFVQINPLATGAIDAIELGTNPFQNYGAYPGRPVQDLFDPVYRVCRGMPRLIAYTGMRIVSPETPIGSVAGINDACRVVDVRALNDNQLIELFVKRKLAPPPPPVGGGTLSVPAPSAAPATGGAANQPSGRAAKQPAPTNAQGSPAK